MDVVLSTFGQTTQKIDSFESTQQQESATETATETPAVDSPDTQVAEQTTETPAQETESNISNFEIPGSQTEEPATVGKTEPTTTAPSFDLKTELKKQDRKTVLKELGVNDFSIELDEYLAKGGKAIDYLNAKSINYDSVSDEDLIKDDFRKQFPNLSTAEISRLFSRKYGVNDDMTEDEQQDRLLMLKADGYTIRSKKIAEQQSFKIPDSPILPKDEAYENWKAQQEMIPQLEKETREFFENHSATKSLKESKRVAIDLGEGVKPFNFSINNPDFFTKAFTDGGKTWQQLTSTQTGEPDVQKQHLILLFAANPNQFVKDIFNYGKSMGVRKELVEEGQNAQRQSVRAEDVKPAGVVVNGISTFGARTR